MVLMSYYPGLDKVWEKAKAESLKIADRLPLPLHYILNGLFMVAWLGDIIIPDPLPFLDEGILTVGLYYYNAYILKRTFGVLNPVRIIRGQSPTAKRRLGLLPYEGQLDQIKSQIKAMRKAAKSAEIPGLTSKKVDQLGDRVREIEKRLAVLDRLFTRPAFQEGAVKSDLARIQAHLEMSDDPGLKAEYQKAVEHAQNHIANIARLQDERNRLVARLERFRLQLDNTYSALLASAAAAGAETDTERLFDELFTSVNAFDVSLQELAAQPSADLFQAAVKEVEATEARVQAQLASRQTTKT